MTARGCVQSKAISDAELWISPEQPSFAREFEVNILHFGIEAAKRFGLATDA
jgi:hypothetical protein